MNHRHLVCIHGRAQQFKDATALKVEWLGALQEGLSKNGLTLPIPESQVHFPYYGQTLHDLLKGASEEDAADVIVKGEDSDDEFEMFAAAIFDEVRRKLELSDKLLVEAGGNPEVIQKGILNWPWVRAALKGLDKSVPGASGASIAVFTNDVYQYLSNPGLRTEIDSGVCSAFETDAETVVVSHSLGTVVAYNVLRMEADARGWQIPLHITLGSPLGIRVIKDRLRPISRPTNVKKWLNALDQRDFVALYPLTPDVFPVDPPIENKTDIDNKTSNHHGIIGYLDDAEVARQIYEALAVS